MRLATDEESHIYMKKAESWFAFAPSGTMFKDCKRITIMSVAEYLANQDNITLYESCAS